MLVLAIVLILVFVVPFGFVISGYGGLTAKIDNLVWGYDPDKTHQWIDYEVTDTFATVVPNSALGLGCTGLRCEIGQPQFRATEQTYYNEIEETLDNGDELKRTWEVRIAYFDMGITVRTYAGGLFDINDVSFFIEISENDFNVFQNADEVKAYILEIVTVKPIEISDLTLFEGFPAASGYSFDMDAIGIGSIPSWMADSGYQDVLSTLETVQFEINVIRARPYSLTPLIRAEQQGTWNLEIRALVFGFWEVLSPYDSWIPGEVWEGFFPWLDEFILGLQLIIGAIFGLIVTVAVMRIPIHPLIKIVVLGGLWILIFVGFGGVALFGV